MKEPFNIDIRDDEDVEKSGGFSGPEGGGPSNFFFLLFPPLSSSPGPLPGPVPLDEPGGREASER